ncbi:MAG: hypothetical protein AAFY88_10305 [Acidobacteriota bacterium]
MKKLGLTVALCLFAVLAAGAASAAPAFDVDASTQGLTFSTDFAYGDAYVTVSGPESVFHRAKISDGASLQTGFGELLADGEYSWELLMVEPLNDEFRRSMAALRRGEKSSPAPTVASHAFTGSFRVEGGAVVEPRHVSQGDRDLATKDIVQNDDVIIRFSLCVGNDCANGEVFSFDTVRLKENNLRVHFDDTSGGAFPSNDWRLIINDSANGGSSHFSIEDATVGRSPFRVEAAAPANALVVDSSGNIGNGTLNPVAEIHIVDGDSPTVRLEQNGSSGFGPQTWDIAGNETNFFVRDATNGSALPFRIRPSAPGNSIFIDTDGAVGLNTASPDGRLAVVDNAGGNSDMIYLENNGKITIRTENTGAGGAIWDFSNDGAFNISRVGSGTNELRLNNAGTLTITGSLIAQGGDGSTDPGDTFPDYVFAPDYELMSIQDLESFVTSNRHLPNVPSAADISAAGGINMTELQLRLLEKVEELTLYTIAQEKLLDAQRQLLREQGESTAATIEAQAEAIRILTERLDALQVE